MIDYKLSLYWYETPLTSKNDYLINSLFGVKTKSLNTHLCHFFISSSQVENHKRITKQKKYTKRYNFCDALTYTLGNVSVLFNITH